MTTQEMLWGVSGASAVVAGIAEWRRDRRRNLDQVGWMLWRGIQFIAFGIAWWQRRLR